MQSLRRLAAIMFTDIVGYTSLMGQDEQGAMELLKKNRSIHKPLIAHFGGKFLKEIGDGVLASFESPSSAVLCAAAIQEKCSEAGISLRIGMHQGEVIFQDGDVFGDGVNIASRIEPLADPGQILISGDIQRNVRNTAGIETDFRSEEQLKHVQGRTRIFEVSVDPYVLKNELTAFSGKAVKVTGRPQNMKNLIRWMAIGFVGIGAGAALWINISSSDKVEGMDAVTVRKFRDMTVAVLPFEGPVTGGLKEFGAMAPYWISRRLVEVTDGKVIDAGDATGHEQLTEDFIQKTGIEAVIEGRYFTADVANAPIELYVDVINLKTNEKYNVGYFTGPREDASKVLDEATQRILSIWALSDKTRFGQSPPRYDAFREYEKAGETWGIDYDKSRAHLIRSYELDTTFYEPLVKLALSYSNTGDLSRQDSMLQYIRDKDPELDRWTELRLESARASVNGDNEGVLQACLKMIEIDPHEVIAPYMASLFALITNQPDLALNILGKSAPQNYNLMSYEGRCNWAMHTLVLAHLRLQEYEEAMEVFNMSDCTIHYAPTAYAHINACIHLGQFDKLPALIKMYGAGEVFWWNGDTVDRIDLTKVACREMYFNGNHNQLAKYATLLPENDEESQWGQFFLGNFERAYHLAKQQYQDTSDMGDLARLAFFAVHARDTVSALAYQDRLVEWPKEDYDRGTKNFLLAQIKTALGEKEAALDLLKQSVEEGYSFLFIVFDLQFYQLHDYPPFQEFIRPK